MNGRNGWKRFAFEKPKSKGFYQVLCKNQYGHEFVAADFWSEEKNAFTEYGKTVRDWQPFAEIPAGGASEQ